MNALPTRRGRQSNRSTVIMLYDCSGSQGFVSRGYILAGDLRG